MGNKNEGEKTGTSKETTLDELIRKIIHDESQVEELKKWLSDKYTIDELKKLIKDKNKISVLKNVLADKNRAKTLKGWLNDENKIDDLINLSKQRTDIDSLIKISKHKTDIDKGVYGISRYLELPVRQGLELMLCVPVFLQDPLTAMEKPELGIQGVWVRYEKGLREGPTNARVAVVDYNGDSQEVISPIQWDADEKWFRFPADSGKDAKKLLLTVNELPDDIAKEHLQAEASVIEKQKYKDFVMAMVKNPYYHQLNVWAVVQRTIEFYEHGWGMGRALPWGFEGNRLLVVPHAGYGQNAYYDRTSKSLQFYYYGDNFNPGFTCLFHDVITHETGHAALDGIRPLYNKTSSLETSAFHEYMGDITTVLLSLFNRDVRHYMARSFDQTTNWQFDSSVLSNVAEQFGKEVEDRDYLRSAATKNNMKSPDILGSLSPHEVSTVLTATMFDILLGIIQKHMDKNETEDEIESPESNVKKTEVFPKEALNWAAQRFQRMVLQPLDFCPPCDIQFVDYARAVLRHALLTNPVDKQGYLPMMLRIFHERKLCTNCGYDASDPKNTVPEKCEFFEVLEGDLPDLKCYEIGTVSNSKTAAYYFINENREKLYIPDRQDFVITDLYETRKLNVADNRQPVEYVIEYVWQEQMKLENSIELDFGDWKDKKVFIDCGGTLVFDDMGNLRSWFHKPGVEFFSQPEIVEAIDNNSKKTKKWKKAADLKIDAEKRRMNFKVYIAELIQGSHIGPVQPDNAFTDVLKPILAVEEGGVVHFESVPHVRKSEFGPEEDRWEIDY